MQFTDFVLKGKREIVAEGQQVFHQRIFWGRMEGLLIFVQRLENNILQVLIQTV